MSGKFRLYTPKVVMSEILEHIDEIAERAELKRNEVLYFLNTFFSIMHRFL